MRAMYSESERIYGTLLRWTIRDSAKKIRISTLDIPSSLSSLFNATTQHFSHLFLQQPLGLLSELLRGKSGLKCRMCILLVLPAEVTSTMKLQVTFPSVISPFKVGSYRTMHPEYFDVSNRKRSRIHPQFTLTIHSKLERWYSRVFVALVSRWNIDRRIGSTPQRCALRGVIIKNRFLRVVCSRALAFIETPSSSAENSSFETCQLQLGRPKAFSTVVNYWHVTNEK
ncbi:uncharacterized protein LOC135161614 isoform X2 [Diachasmimorpha longicaudata]|uniref:uncharacterized protein LOC135161614 isoform X2 n=1 Tax=Diachasmimorpha longicaudata TaxID=58733 RepID=UPI0030B8958F